MRRSMSRLIKITRRKNFRQAYLQFIEARDRLTAPLDSNELKPETTEKVLQADELKPETAEIAVQAELINTKSSFSV